MECFKLTKNMLNIKFSTFPIQDTHVLIFQLKTFLIRLVLQDVPIQLFKHALVECVVRLFSFSLNS